jgi:hypothetical protein
VTVDEQLLSVTERGKDVALEAASGRVLERRSVDDEKARVDQVVREDRLLLELHDLVIGRDVERAELGGERYDADRRRAGVLTMAVQQRAQVDVADAIAVREEELLTHPVEASDYAVAGVGVLSGVDDRYRPIA